MTLFLRKRSMPKEQSDIDSSQATTFLDVKKSESDIESRQESTENGVVETEIKPAHIICPDCGGITLEGLDYCHRCGGELKPTD